MKTLLLTLIFLLSGELTIGQTFTVYEVRKCFYANGGRIKKGDTLSLQSKFTIQKSGEIELTFIDQWSFRRNNVGNYAMDTIYSNLKRLKTFRTIDSIYQVLKDNRIADCKFNYKYSSKFKKLTDGSVVSWSDTDNIKVKNNQRIETTDSIVLIEWDYPVDYSGKYFLLLSSMFDEYIDVLTTSDESIELDLGKYRGIHQLIMYKVISEECRESNNSHVIVLK